PVFFTGLIKDGRSFHVFDKTRKEYRKAEYRDIVILLRTTRKWADVFAEELSLTGIPVFADTGTGFFKTVEVQVILSLLQIIDNPCQDIPLLSVLRSPIVSFTTDELTDLRLLEPKGPLFDGLVKLAAQNEGETSRKARRFLDRLNLWRESSLYLSTDQLIWKLYDDTGYYGIVGAMPGGEQRQANLRILFERARQFEQTSYKGLFNFISFIDRIRTGRGDLGSAKVLSENDNVVRIMSIHKSKGLEFPVVILAGCGKRFNLQDMNESILLHHDLGFGPDVVDYRRRLSWNSAAKEAIRMKIRSETLSEEMRILYVAMTRAREKLIITGSVGNIEKMALKWFSVSNMNSGKLPAYEMLNGSTFLDWICPAAIRHKDCEKLRAAAGADNPDKAHLQEDSSHWYVELWNKNDFTGGEEPEQTDDNKVWQWLESDESRADDILADDIDRRLKWKYPFTESSNIPAKVSVTELKRWFDIQYDQDASFIPEPDAVLVKKPGFLEGKKGLSSAEKGTILHFIMQHLDLFAIREKPTTGTVRDQVDLMVKKDLLTRTQAESVDL
ncbi:MAG TPA: helicase-exonuclease AddAB subunit AddA, partial [Clostridiaceae bacterium]|nr:helicase-exonuclease AddAB subunit AddA [Clostridiaceae bacterium]